MAIATFIVGTVALCIAIFVIGVVTFPVWGLGLMIVGLCIGIGIPCCCPGKKRPKGWREKMKTRSFKNKTVI